MNVSDLSRLLLFWIATFSCLFFISFSDCKFSASGHTLDITNLGQVQTTYKQWTVLGEHCKNGFKCNSQDAMVIQDNSGTCTAYLAKYLSTITPTYSSSKGGTWTFAYSNGDATGCDSNRKLNLILVCSSSSAAYDSSSTYFEESTEKCSYNWYIYTQYACVSGSSSSSTDDGEMSAGSWMILLIFLFILFYCVIGYIWNVRKSSDQNWKDYKSNTPHLGFWCMIPKWTWAGCCVSKEFVMTKYAQYRGGGGGGNAEMLTATGDEEDA